VIEVDDHLPKVEIDDFNHAADGSGKKQPKANVKCEEAQVELNHGRA
jgi:hypothetical protein